MEKSKIMADFSRKKGNLKERLEKIKNYIPTNIYEGLILAIANINSEEDYNVLDKIIEELEEISKNFKNKEVVDLYNKLVAINKQINKYNKKPKKKLNDKENKNKENSTKI